MLLMRYFTLFFYVLNLWKLVYILYLQHISIWITTFQVLSSYCGYHLGLCNCNAFAQWFANLLIHRKYTQRHLLKDFPVALSILIKYLYRKIQKSHQAHQVMLIQQSMDKYMGIAALPQSCKCNEIFVDIIKQLASWKNLSNIMGSPVGRMFRTPLKSFQKVTIILIFEEQYGESSSWRR